VNPWTLYAASGVVVFALALHAVFTHEQAVRRIIAANVLGTGVCLVLVGIAHRIATAIDPVPHALVLTGIVVTVSATACGLALAKRLARADGSDDLETP
jgi:multicomponent Na+:H+ antiporter subunit C